MLEINSIQYSYSKAFSLRDITFQLQAGEILGVIGESGCGKSTLLKLIFGELEPEKGKITYKGEKILGPSEQLIIGHEDFKYVSQEFDLMPFISVLENVIKPLSRQYMSENRDKAQRLLSVVGLEDYAHRKVKNLSGGQKQRVAIAQALAKTPKLLLLDEPFSHIDQFFKNKLRRKLFSYLREEQISCVLVTHDKGDVLPFSDKILVIKDGKQLALQSPNLLFEIPKHPYIAGLFGDYNMLNAKDIFENTATKENLIVYPQDMVLEESISKEIEVLQQYFMGYHYKVLLRWKTYNLIVHTLQKLDVSKAYTLNFDTEKIAKRNNFSQS